MRAQTFEQWQGLSEDSDALLIVCAQAIQDTQAGIRHDLEGHISTGDGQRVSTLNGLQGLIIRTKEY
jgi:hypothetical protein